LSNYLGRSKTGFYKIIRFLTAVNRHRNDGKEKHAEEKSNKEFLDYIPVYFLHERSKSKRKIVGEL